MTINWSKQAQPQVSTLKPYVPGKPIEELARDGVANIIKLASNENPLGCSPKVTEALQQAACTVNRYPDGAAYALVEKLAQKHDLSTNHFTLGNGTDELLRILMQAFINPGDEVIISDYAFASYEISAHLFQGKVVRIPTDNFATRIKAIPSLVTEKTKLIFLANPNNPTGTWFTHGELLSVLEALPSNVILLLDEAYYEYAADLADYPDALSLQKQFENLVVTRTFSKVYGLAGVRLGYLMAQPDISSLLNAVRLPFNSNLLAQTAALVALDDQDFIKQSIEVNKEGLLALREGLESLGLSAIESVGNFLTVDFAKPAADINNSLLQQGVIVRPLLNYGMPNHLRMSIGTKTENERLLQTLSKIV